MSNKTKKEEAEEMFYKGIAVIIMLPFYSLLFQYILWNIAGIDVAWYWDVVGTALLFNWILPSSFMVWLLILYGVNTHFIG